jgi:pyruvate formate-lyase activating enzyme-like uncharacterized protein
MQLKGPAPAWLQSICAQVAASTPVQSNLQRLKSRWSAHLTKLTQQVPQVQVEDQGEIVCLGEMSPGCRACKQGKWDCIFMTMRCDLACRFCYSPDGIDRRYRGSAFGTKPEQLADVYSRAGIEGIAFTGGEPLLEKQVLFTWLAFLKQKCPDCYFWLYTNGLAADRETLQTLGTLGLDEVRFNMAATGYRDPSVSRNLAQAVGSISNVTVEIPSIPEDEPQLLAAVREWDRLGVKFLNLHELLFEPGSRSGSMYGPRLDVVLTDGHRTAVDPRSRPLTLKVMKVVSEEQLSIRVNDCSLQSKVRQVRTRRATLGQQTAAPHERIAGDLLESWCAYAGEDEYVLFRPDELAEKQALLPGYYFVRLARLAPLALGELPRWVLCEEAGETQAGFPGTQIDC